MLIFNLNKVDILNFLKQIKGLIPSDSMEWPEMLAETPHVKEADLPPGTVVFVRGDIDSKKKLDEEKLDSQAETLKYCIKKGWKVLLTGHRNRPTESDQKEFFEGKGDPVFLFEPAIRSYLEKLVDHPLLYVRNWLNEEGSALTQDFYSVFETMKNGDILLLENERMWDFLWNDLWAAKDELTLNALAMRYEKIGSELVQKVGLMAHINDAASDAKNINFTTVALLPFLKHATLGFHFKEDLEKIKEARKAKLVCFSGAKLDKIKHIQKIVERGYVNLIITGGLIALPFIKAKANREGLTLSLGAVGDPKQQELNRELYISSELIAEAEEIYNKIEKKGLKLKILNPVDFKLDDETFTEDTNIPEGRSAWDIGPKSIHQIHQVMEQYGLTYADQASEHPIFLNGFLGRMELPAFAAGTKAWSEEVGRLAAHGFKVIAGGGEGRQVYDGASVIISGGTAIQGMGNGGIPALKATWLFNHSH